MTIRTGGRLWYFYLMYLWTLWADLWGWIFLSLLRIFPARVAVEFIQYGKDKHTVKGLQLRKWTTLAQKLHGIDGGLWVVFTPGTWMAKRVKYSGGCIGNGGWLRNAGDLSVVDTKTEFHEHIHQHQFQVMQLYVLVVTLYNYFVCGANWWTFALMPVGGALAYVCAMIVALLRGEEVYRDNIMEESAYAQAAGFNAQASGPHDIARRYAEQQHGL